MTLLTSLRAHLADALDAKAAAIEAQAKVDALDSFARDHEALPLLDSTVPDAARLYDDIVREMATRVDPEFESDDEAAAVGYRIGSFAAALVETRAALVEDEQ